MTCGKSTELCLSVQIQQPNTEPGASGPAAGSGTTDTADVQREPLPTARTLLDEPAVVPGDDHSYSLPPNTAGQAEHLNTAAVAPEFGPCLAYTGASSSR